MSLVSKKTDKSTDKKQTFLIPDLNIRGVILNLRDSWQEILLRRNYPDKEAFLLGEFSVASLLISSNIKFNGKITMQLQSPSSLELLVSQVTKVNSYRSLIKYKDNLTGDLVKDTQNDGVIAITVEYDKNKQPYQGLVGVEYASLSENLEQYYRQSEQLTTLIRLSSDKKHAAGILLQTLPANKENPQYADAEDLARMSYLLDTFDLNEIADYGNQTVLSRLFAEDDIEVFPEQDIVFACGCSEENTLVMLSNLPEEDINDIITKEENVEINCEFCGKTYKHTYEILADAVYAKKAHEHNLLH